MPLSAPLEKNFLRTLAAVNFVHILDFMVLMPLAPFLISYFGINTHDFSFLVAVYAVTAAVTGVMMGGVIDRFDRSRLFFGVFAVFIAATLACAFAGSYLFLILARAVAGGSGGLLGSMVKTLVTDMVPAPRRGQAMGYVMLGFSLATVLGVPLGLAVAAHSGDLSWRATFVLVAAIGLLVFVIAWYTLPRVPPHPQHGRGMWGQLWKMVSIRAHLEAYVFILLMVLGAFSIIPFIALYMVSNVGVGSDHLFYMYLFGGIATFLVMRPFGRLSDRFGSRRVFTVGALLSLLPLWVLTHLQVSPLWWALVVTTTFFLSMSLRMVPAQTLMTLQPDAAHRAGFMSVQSSVEQIALGLGSVIGGMVVNQVDGRLLNFEVAGYVAGGFTLAAVLWSRRLLKAR